MPWCRLSVCLDVLKSIPHGSFEMLSPRARHVWDPTGSQGAASGAGTVDVWASRTNMMQLRFTFPIAPLFLFVMCLWQGCCGSPDLASLSASGNPRIGGNSQQHMLTLFAMYVA